MKTSTSILKRADARTTTKSLHTALELTRGMLEASTLPWSWPLLRNAPKGDGHPVLLIPGFMAEESSMAALKMYLTNRGYAVESWGFGRNLGFQVKHAAALERKLEFMHHKHGRKISVVGWSLGGLFGLYASHRAPQCVRSLITLGSPVTPVAGGGGAARSVLAMYRAVAHRLGPDAHMHLPHVRKALAHRPEHPVSCLYSRSDGVVPPAEAQFRGDSPLHENILVPGSHLGLGFNPMVLWIVAERLSQAEGDWQRFNPTGLTGAAYQAATGVFRMPLPSASRGSSHDQ